MADTRIYVASLSDYNAGRLHGCFIDLDETTDVDDVWAAINAMLAASPEYRAFPQGGPAEEWAIHDYEGFGGIRLGENESIEKVVEIAAAIAEHGEAYTAFVGNAGETDVGAFAESFRGEWGSEEDYAREFIADCGGPDGVTVAQIDKLECYLDWDALTRWATADGWTATLGNGNVAIFADY